MSDFILCAQEYPKHWS